jgi:hypothetical protein
MPLLPLAVMLAPAFSNLLISLSCPVLAAYQRASSSFFPAQTLFSDFAAEASTCSVRSLIFLGCASCRFSLWAMPSLSHKGNKNSAKDPTQKLLKPFSAIT